MGAKEAGPLTVGPLVLAAGKGLRFGGGKLLASYRGRPLLSHVLDVVGAACERRILKGGCAVAFAEDEDSRAGLAALERPKPGEPTR